MMIGKAVKLAAGHLDTHGRGSTMDRELIVSMLEESGCDRLILEKTHNINLARELWDIIPQDNIGRFVEVLTEHCHKACNHILTKEQLEIIILKDE